MNWENFYPFKIIPHNLLLNSGTAIWTSQSWELGTAAVVQLGRLLLQMDAGDLQTTGPVDVLNLNPPTEFMPGGGSVGTLSVFIPHLSLSLLSGL